MKITLFKQRFEFLPLIFVTVTTLTLISFGNWQLRRLGEKEIFIHTIEENVKNPPIAIENINTDSPYYSKIKLSGKFLPDNNVFLYGRRTASPEKHGYYLISAFAATNGGTYLVSRGWLPQSVKDDIGTKLSLEQEEETIEAIILPGEEKNFFVPENDKKNNIWFTLDLKMASEILGTTNKDFYLMQINSQTLPEGASPLFTNNLNKVRNDHLEYAITWYSLAVCLLIIFIIYVRKQDYT